MKKIIPLVICLFISFLIFAKNSSFFPHNPLQGTKWEMKDEKDNSVFTIDFETGTTGTLNSGKQNCEFTYSANHTLLVIKISKCEPAENKAGIIPCCEQQSIPFRGDEEGNLILIIGEKEFVLVPVR